MADLVVSPALTIPAGELRVSFARSGGPGGQHVNKTSTKVELRWSVRDSAALSERDRAWLVKRLGSKLTSEGELLVVSAEGRSQSSNRESARRRLVEIVAAALRRPRKRRATRPTKASVERRISEKKRRGRKKADRQRKPDS